MKTLRKGHMGATVARWQLLIGIRDSGDFDDATEIATMLWQTAHGLEADGIVGPRSWAMVGVVESVTEDIDDAFFPRLRLIGMSLGARPLDLLCVMYNESGCRATAWNDEPRALPPDERYNASGLIQFMPATLLGLGWTDGHAAFRMLSATEQLTWVERYYRPYRGLLVSVGAIYTATFLPALIGHAGNRDYVLTAEKGQLPWAYRPNAGFDANHDLKITVGELEDSVTRHCVGARWEELRARLTVHDDDPTLPEMPSSVRVSAADNPTIHVSPSVYLGNEPPEDEES